jgi:hypothetical protein
MNSSSSSDSSNADKSKSMNVDTDAVVISSNLETFNNHSTNGSDMVGSDGVGDDNICYFINKLKTKLTQLKTSTKIKKESKKRKNDSVIPRISSKWKISKTNKTISSP